METLVTKIVSIVLRPNFSLWSKELLKKPWNSFSDMD